MRSHPALAVALLAVLLLPNRSPAATLQIAYDSRYTNNSQEVDAPAPGASEFHSSLDASAGNFAGQDSEISLDQISGTGSALGFGVSTLDVSFYVLEPSQFTLTGSMSGSVVQAVLTDQLGAHIDLSSPISVTQSLPANDTWRLIVSVGYPGGPTGVPVTSAWQVVLKLPEPAGLAALTLLGAAWCLRRRTPLRPPPACR
ncbi:MAG TPA: hypothetical protein VMR86_15580 [Myxococcota bacterium]|nr:hypothetical protein [Myxococcota bacterium]